MKSILVALALATAAATSPQQYLAYNFRPLLKYGQDLVVGAVQGFIGVDLTQPLYCFTDGPAARHAAAALAERYATSNVDRSDVFINIVDTSLPQIFNCNPLTMLGGPAALALYYHGSDLATWATTKGVPSPLLGIVGALAGAKMANDLFLTLYSGLYLYLSHFDLRNMAYVVTMLGVTYMSVMGSLSFYYQAI